MRCYSLARGGLITHTHTHTHTHTRTHTWTFLPPLAHSSTFSECEWCFCWEMSPWPVGLCVSWKKTLDGNNPTRPPGHTHMHTHAHTHTHWMAKADHLQFKPSWQTEGLLCCIHRIPLPQRRFHWCRCLILHSNSHGISLYFYILQTFERALHYYKNTPRYIHFYVAVEKLCTRLWSLYILVLQ